MTDVIGEACALAITDLNTTINHEPRVLDLLLAERLGFERPRAIRQIIERNLPELEMHGSLATQRGKSRGQEFTEYWLSEGQALAVCALSRTPQAAAIRHQLITVFMAYRRGQLPSPTPSDAKAQADAARAAIAAMYERGFVMKLPPLDSSLLRHADIGRVTFTRMVWEVV